jgi:general secretion pathway protein F
MALYQYSAYLESGKKIKEIINANSIDEAKEILISQNITLIDLVDLSNDAISYKLSKNEQLEFIGDLSKLLNASLPLYDALIALEEKYRKSKPHCVILDLCDRIKNGISFSDALSAHMGSFDVLYVSMIKNAQKLGNLPQTLSEIHDLLLKQQKLKKQLFSALLYPGILICFCFVVMIALLFFILPSLFELFEQRQNLHPLTYFVLTISKFFHSNRFIIISIIAVLSSCLGYFFSSAKQRKKLFTLFLKIPFFNNLITKASIMRFCLSFSSLLSGGVSYINAMELAKSLLKHPKLEKDIDLALDKILQGAKLSQEIKKSKNFPPLVSRMIAIAEDGGDMPDMLNNIAKVYEYEFEKSLTQITALLQPMILLFLGVVIGFIVLSVLLPLTDVSSFIAE